MCSSPCSYHLCYLPCVYVKSKPMRLKILSPLGAFPSRRAAIVSAPTAMSSGRAELCLAAGCAGRINPAVPALCRRRGALAAFEMQAPHLPSATGLAWALLGELGGEHHSEAGRRRGSSGYRNALKNRSPSPVDLLSLWLERLYGCFVNSWEGFPIILQSL